MKDRALGKIIFGGCSIDEKFQPDYQCNKCAYQWDKKKPVDGIFASKDEIE